MTNQNTNINITRKERIARDRKNGKKSEVAMTMTRKERISRDKKKQPNRLLKALFSAAVAVSVLGAGPAMTTNAADCGCIEYSGYHMVKKGDTLYSIAKKHNVTTEQLMAANFTDKTVIRVGEKLMIPAKNQPWMGNVKQPIQKTQMYKVQPGDTLYSVAKRTGSTVTKLKAANGLVSDTIRVGQVLKVKENAEQVVKKGGMKKLLFTTYTVKAGDTKYSLKNKFGQTVSFPSGTLKAGQKLKITGNIWKIKEADFALADGRVIEVSSGEKRIPVNVYEGNSSIEHLAYGTKQNLSFVVVEVGPKKELVSYTVEK